MEPKHVNWARLVLVRLVGADLRVRPATNPDVSNLGTPFPTRNWVVGDRADTSVRPYQTFHSGLPELARNQMAARFAAERYATVGNTEYLLNIIDIRGPSCYRVHHSSGRIGADWTEGTDAP